MGKKYLETKKNSIESSIIGVWEDAAKLNEYKTKLGERKRVAGGDGRRTENKKLKGVEVTEGSKEEYEKFFNAAMKKFNINSPADLKSDEEKKKFFDYVDKNYTGEKNEEVELDEASKFSNADFILGFAVPWAKNPTTQYEPHLVNYVGTTVKVSSSNYLTSKLDFNSVAILDYFYTYPSPPRGQEPVLCLHQGQLLLSYPS